MKTNINVGLKIWAKNDLAVKKRLIKRVRSRFNLIILSFMLSIFLNVHADSSGKDLFNTSCMICHADDGSGAMPGVIDLTENRDWSRLPEKQLLANLNKGSQKPGSGLNMPPKGGNPNLTDKDLLLIISYMRKEFLK